MTKLKLFIVGLFVLFSQYALSYQCEPSGGSPKVYNFSFTFDSNQNEINYKTGYQSESASGNYRLVTPCNILDDTWWTAAVGENLTSASSDDDGSWYDITGNDYLQVAMELQVFNGSDKSTTYKSVPFVDFENHCNSSVCNGNASTGSHAKINIRIKKKFIGESWLENVPVFYLYANQKGSGQGTGSPIVIGYLTAMITVPQSCDINANQIVTFDFGNIAASQFSKAGAGNMPTTSSPQTKSISIKCNNIDAQASLTMRLEAENTSGKIVISDNSDIGFIVADSNGNELTPNDDTSLINFKLDDNSESNVSIKSWPVSVTGNKPAEGVFTAKSYLRVDFE